MKFYQPPSLAVHFFTSPPLLLVLKCTNFRSPPFGCLKIFGAPPPSISSSPPLVILNELSLTECQFVLDHAPGGDSTNVLRMVHVTWVGINWNHVSLADCLNLCTYQRLSRGVDHGEPLGICTETFANSTYPRPIFFHKKLPLSLPRENNVKGLPNCNVISCIIFNKRLTIIYTVSKNS